MKYETHPKIHMRHTCTQTMPAINLCPSAMKVKTNLVMVKNIMPTPQAFVVCSCCRAILTAEYANRKKTPPELHFVPNYYEPMISTISRMKPNTRLRETFTYSWNSGFDETI